MIPALPAPVEVLRNARLADGAVVDVRLDGPVVAAIEPVGVLPSTAGLELDLDGFVLLTAGAEPHAHLDKALTFDDIDPPLGDLPSAIASFHAYAITADEHDIAGRARRTLGRMLANGVTAVRTHVNFSPGPDPLAGFRALDTVRREFAGLVDVQLVTLPADDVPDGVHEAAFALGADLVGGAPHLWPDPIAATDRLLDLAERLGVGADLHADESLDGPITLARFAERARHWSVSRSA
ncbi:MAG TPA: cytosine deaminase, partial [Amnibacterium sp.]|nr:cytosine deaminase [Amnibacterium sp.]